MYVYHKDIRITLFTPIPTLISTKSVFSLFPGNSNVPFRRHRSLDLESRK